MFLLGRWSNFEELEESLSLQELDLIRTTRNKIDGDDRRFAAAIQGVNLDSDLVDRRKEIEERANARIAGVDIAKMKDLSLGDLGFEITSEE